MDYDVQTPRIKEFFDSTWILLDLDRRTDSDFGEMSIVSPSTRSKTYISIGTDRRYGPKQK